jgi:hypothetical protein
MKRKLEKLRKLTAEIADEAMDLGLTEVDNATLKMVTAVGDFIQICENHT